MKNYYLKTSEIFVSNEEYKITTVLGSCVAVCLWDKKLKFGGMIHYLLPKWYSRQPQSHKFGDYAIPDLIRQMSKFGSTIGNMQVQIYGGATVLQEGLKIGEKNVEIAFEMIKKIGIPIIKSDVGGIVARKIIFYNFDNKTELIKLQKTI